MSTIPADLDPATLTALVDQREQRPWDLAPLRQEPATLQTGDYSVKGCEHLVRIERKCLGDLVQCCGNERERFTREVERLLAFPARVLIVEASWAAVAAGDWRSQIKPQSVEASLLAWIARGLPCVLAGNRERAQRYAAKILYLVARDQWRSARQLLGEVKPRPKRLSPNAQDPETINSFCLEDAESEAFA